MEISRVVVSPTDSVLLFDPALSRVSVLSNDLEFARSFPLPASPYEFHVRTDGTLVAQFMLFSPERAGLPVQLMDAAGRLERSFGSTAPEYDRRNPFGRYRAITLAEQERVWTAFHNRYELELWDDSGERLEHLARSVPWFTAWTAYEPPIPTLRSIRQDADGLLWVLINVPDSRYRQPTVPPAVDDVSVWDLRSDTMIEVIDPGRAIVVAQRRFDPLFTQFVGPLVYAHREGADGEIVVDVYRLSLQR